MEQNADVFKLLVYTVTFCVLGLPFIRTLLASSGKKILVLPSKIRKGKRAVKSSKNTTKKRHVDLALSRRILCEKFVAESKFGMSEDAVKAAKRAQNENGGMDLLIHPIDEAMRWSVTRTCGQQVNPINLRCPEKANQIKAMEIHFPEEVITNILCRLPVLSLLRFKCVSKFWKTLISEPYLQRQQLNHAKNNQNSQKLLFSTRCPKNDRQLFYFSSLSMIEGVRELDCASSHECCYGIACCYEGLSVLVSVDCTDLLLWNPFTRESIVLSNPEFPGLIYCSYGLGYDSTSDDYKIFMMYDRHCKILALKSGSWRKVDQCPHSLRNEVTEIDFLTFFRGAFHWIGVDTSQKYSVVSFNVSTEVYRMMPLPEQLIFSSDEKSHGVLELGGQFCAFCSQTTHGGLFKVWVMKVYGDAESWTELLTVQDHCISYVIPIYQFPDGELILFLEDNYETRFRTPQGSYALFPKDPYHQQGFVITESLISPKLLI